MIKADISTDGSITRFPVLPEEVARQVIYEIVDSYIEWLGVTFGANADPEELLKQMTEERRRLRESSCRIFQTLEDPARRNRCEWTPQPLRLYIRYREGTGFQIIVVSNDDGYSDVRPWIPDKYK